MDKNLYDLPPAERPLPTCVLRDRYADGHSQEANAVQRKFSNPAAEFEEKSDDQIAMSYFNPEAALFWLPKYIKYIKNNVNADSNHPDSLLQLLANKDFFAKPLFEIASKSEKKLVRDWLDWYHPSRRLPEGGALAEVLNNARTFWAQSDTT